MILHAIPLIKLFPPWGKSDTKDIGLPLSVPYCLSSHVPLIRGFSKVILTTPDLTIHTVFRTQCFDMCTLYERDFLASVRGRSIYLICHIDSVCPISFNSKKGHTNQPTTVTQSQTQGPMRLIYDWSGWSQGEVREGSLEEAVNYIDILHSVP